MTSENPQVTSDDLAAVQRCKEAYDRIRQELAEVIVGQSDVIEQVLIAIFARGHALLEGVPGLAKTLLVSSLAEATHLGFKRIQFTPDLMPSDVTGTQIIQEDPETRRRQYQFLPGPLFANMILADEVNRTPPKTQAAMLEAMQERQISSGGQIHRCPTRSSSWPRRTRWNRKAPIRCPRPSWTVSSSTSRSAIPVRPRNGTSRGGSPPASKARSRPRSAARTSFDSSNWFAACR